MSRRPRDRSWAGPGGGACAWPCGWKVGSGTASPTIQAAQAGEPLSARPPLDPVEVEARRQLQVVRGEQLAVGEDLVARAVAGDRAGGEDHRALAQLGREREVVRRHEHRPLDAGEHVEQLAPRARVEARRRLVEHEQRRAHRQHRRDRHAPPLPHRELVGRALGDVPHAHRVERLGDALGRRRPVEAHVERPERDVLRDGRHEQLVVGVLEDEPDARAQLVHVVAAHLESRHLEAPLPHEQPVEVEHERRLARPVRAEQRDALAVPDVEVDAAQRVVPARVAVREPAGVDGAAHGSAPITRSGTTASTTAATNATSARPSDSGASCGIAPR